MTSQHCWRWSGLIALASFVAWIAGASAEVQNGRDFQANEDVQTIRVELGVGTGGEDLDEPIALDLGLGFPLWLHQLGRVDSTAAPFGAVSQRGTAAHAIRAGERAAFEFSVSGEAGLDQLRSTPQLLAGLHVSDISRVGFTSQADHGWILSSYAVQINGKLFVSNNGLNVNGRGQQDQARERLTELNRDLGPRQSEIADLKALVTAGLANEADRTQLSKLERTLAPQLAEQRRIERQLRGAAPFFTESGFRPAWRSNGAIEKVKVTVVTAPHTGAETRNYIYFRTGGHKFLLGSAASPLSPNYGPQEFELDLATAPLTASDLRGYALGALANHEPAGDAPDRWHPQRLRVEIDGRVVYDSEDSSIDRASLSAIRLVPPAQINAGGQVVANKPIAREAFVWEAGSGAGLDLVNGGAEALPPENDPTYPHPEPSVVVNPDITIVNQENETWYDPAAGPFPGEMGFGPAWEPGWGPGWDWGFSPPGWGPGGWGPPGWDPGWGPGWTPGPSWLDLLLYGLLNQAGLLPDWVIPDPVGEPPQLEEVQFDVGTNIVQWTVSGNASQIDHFILDIVLIRPDLGVPIVQSITDPIEVAADQRLLASPAWSGLVLPGTFDERSRSYAAIRVTMVPTDPAIGVDPGLAPASPIMATVNPANLSPNLQAIFTPVVGPASVIPVSLAGQPEIPGAAAWIAGQTDTHSGLVFGGFSPLQHHVGARPVTNGDQLVVRFDGHLSGRHRLIAFLGFRGGLEAPADVEVNASCFAWNLGGNHTYHADGHLVSDPTFAPTPLLPLVIDLDPAADIGSGAVDFDARYTIRCNNIDPNHPPMLIGVRLFPLP